LIGVTHYSSPGCRAVVAILAVIILSGCSKTGTPARSTDRQGARAPKATAALPVGAPLKFLYRFQKGSMGWEADFADYPLAQTDTQFDSGIRPLPPELHAGASAYYVQGNNERNYDLFMYVRRRLGPTDGIKENQPYLVAYRISLASNAANDCLPTVGSPGESVFLKAGAAPRMPVSVLKEGTYRLNVDKGEVNMGGKHASLVGTIANGLACRDFSSPAAVPYASITRAHKHPMPVRSNDKGELWLLVGSESAYGALTALYFEQIEVELTPVSSDGH